MPPGVVTSFLWMSSGKWRTVRFTLDDKKSCHGYRTGLESRGVWQPRLIIAQQRSI